MGRGAVEDTDTWLQTGGRGSRSLLSESWGAAKVTLDVTGL